MAESKTIGCLMKKYAAKVWNFYVEFLGYFAFDTYGAGSIQAYAFASLMTLVLLVMLFTAIAAAVAIATAIFSSLKTFLLVAVPIAAIALMVRAAAKTWKRKNGK